MKPIKGTVKVNEATQSKGGSLQGGIDSYLLYSGDYQL